MGVHAASLASHKRLMSGYRRVPHFVPATWRSLAAANIRVTCHPEAHPRPEIVRFQ